MKKRSFVLMNRKCSVGLGFGKRLIRSKWRGDQACSHIDRRGAIRGRTHHLTKPRGGGPIRPDGDRTLTTGGIGTTVGGL